MAGLFEREPMGSFRRVHATASWPDAFLLTIPADDSLMTLVKDTPLLLPDRYWDDRVSPLSLVYVPVLAVPVGSVGCSTASRSSALTQTMRHLIATR